MTKIASIVKSNSHVDYIGRVVDRLDATHPPGTNDYGFAQFVLIPAAEQEVIGVIYDTQLVNPEYGNFGPRLSPPADLSVLTPDYLNEQGVLVGVLLLGWRDLHGSSVYHQTVPRRVIPVGSSVYNLPEKDVHLFHRNTDGELQLHYYSQIIAHAKSFAVPLIEAIIEELEPQCAPDERQRLCVLKKSLVWQRTMGGMRL